MSRPVAADLVTFQRISVGVTQQSRSNGGTVAGASLTQRYPVAASLPLRPVPSMRAQVARWRSICRRFDLPSCGIVGDGAAVIRTDDEMLRAQQCVSNLRTILLRAREVHSPRDYARMAEPILLEIQQRDQEILEHLVTGLDHPTASWPTHWYRRK
jgi:hypothetical protein